MVSLLDCGPFRWWMQIPNTGRLRPPNSKPLVSLLHSTRRQMGVQLRELSELLRGVIKYDLNSQNFHPNHYLWDDDLNFSTACVVAACWGGRGRGR